MTHGTAGSKSSSYGGNSGTSTSPYIDNYVNRSLGRVGMAHATAVHSSSGSSSRSSGYGGTYVDNSVNRSLSRVGMPYATAVHSSSGSSSRSSGYGGTYADNSVNRIRSLGRVGMAHGTHVHSSSGSSSRSSGYGGTYADNSVNRSLGRVGMVHGTAVHSSSGSSSRSSGYGGTYADNPMNHSLGRVGMAHVYPDNHSIGRVGKKMGSHVVHKDGTITLSSGGLDSPGATSRSSSEAASLSSAECYTDNYLNRKLGRVGMKNVHMQHKDGSITTTLPGGLSTTTTMEHPRAQRFYADDAYNINRRKNRVCNSPSSPEGGNRARTFHGPKT